MAGSVESMYLGLVDAGYYMPSYSSSVIDGKYILNVTLGKCFRILRKEVS